MFLTLTHISCLNFWDEACWFLSLRFFGLLSSIDNNKDEDNSPKNLNDKKKTNTHVFIQPLHVSRMWYKVNL